MSLIVPFIQTIYPEHRKKSWISHVPATVTEVKELLAAKSEPANAKK